MTRQEANVYAVTLRKKDDGFGSAPKGDLYRCAFRDPYTEDEAQRRAFRLLQRDRPSENPMAWEIMDVVAA